jgi:Zn-dependent protease with chaperone function
MNPDPILVTCPACGFSKPVPTSKFPLKPITLSCSKCNNSFLFQDHLTPDPTRQKPEASGTGIETDAVICPKCGYQRSECDELFDAGTCPKCHVIYAKWVPSPEVTQEKRRPIDLDKLIYPNESTLFQILIVLAALYWLTFTFTSKGSIVVFLIVFAIAHVLGQAALIAHLKGNGIKITFDQFPELYQRYLDCCNRLEFNEAPEAYLINGSGVLNAFATRFLGRDFVVLYSNVVHGLEDAPEAVNFYLGHELGHVKRKHLLWGPVLWPATLLPLVGAAYSRAREYTCDQFGRACCDSPESAVRGLIALSAGEKLWRGVSVPAYVRQVQESQGFWMSFYELVSDYPWLVKRVARVQNPNAAAPGRHGLAWVLAFFTPRLGVAGAGAGFLITVAIVGILAAIAIPQYSQYRAKAKTFQSEAPPAQFKQNAPSFR